MVWVISLACALVLAAAAYAGFKGLASFRQETGHAWSQIETLLCQRREMVHEFLELANSRIPHVHEHAQALRKIGHSPGGEERLSHFAQAEKEFTLALGHLLEWLDRCPEELIENELQQFREAIDKAEEKILFATQYHNAVAKAHNGKLRRFPHNVLGACLRIKRLELFEVEPITHRHRPASIDVGQAVEA